MPVSVAFLTTVGRNVGDEFIREGVRAILDSALESYEPFYIDKHDRRTLSQPVEDELRLLEDKYLSADIFIQAGAPVYWNFAGGTATSLTSDWYDWVWEQRILNDSIKQHPVFLNLGAGSCDEWGKDGRAFVDDEPCARFARLIGERAALTAVRDPVAAGILKALGIDHHELPCPAFLAAARHEPRRPRTEVVGVNLMPVGGHYQLDPQFDDVRWQKECESLVKELRASNQLLFIAHDETEAAFMGRLSAPTERVFLARSWRDYFDIYGNCRFVIANRVHGAVCAAGFGVPAIILGNDTRALIGKYFDLPILRSAEFAAQSVLNWIADTLSRYDHEVSRLVKLRHQTLQTYVHLVEQGLKGQFGK
jgi:hypothetical protein